MVIDTSVFIEFLRATDKTRTTLYKIPGDSQIFISSVTLYELLIGATSEEKKTDIRILTEKIFLSWHLINKLHIKLQRFIIY